MFDFEPTNYKLYSQLVESVEAIDGQNNDIDSLNLDFRDENNETIDTCKEEKQKSNIVSNIDSSLNDMIGLIQDSARNEFESKFNIYKDCIENKIIPLEEMDKFPFESWTVLSTSAKKIKEVNLFSDTKNMVNFFLSIDDDGLKVSNLQSLCNGIKADNHISYLSTNLYIFMREIIENFNLEKIPLQLLRNNNYEHWNDLLVNKIDIPQKYYNEQIFNQDMMTYLMENMRYNKLELKDWKNTLPDFLLEESNVRSFIEHIFRKNRSYFIKPNRTFDDKLVYMFSKAMCNDTNNLLLEEKLLSVAPNEESKLFVKEFSIFNRYQEMQKTLEVSPIKKNKKQKL